MGAKRGQYLWKKTPGRQIFDGYFITIEDPKHPENYELTHFPDNSTFPCPHTNNLLPTRCGLKINYRLQKELVIPTYNTKAQIPCTAILNMESLQWSRLLNDRRGAEVNEHVDAHLISDETLKHVFFLGGTIDYGWQAMRRPFKNIYRLDDHTGWIKLEAKLSAIFGIIPIPLDFYWTNNWAMLDTNELTPKGMEATVQ